MSPIRSSLLLGAGAAAGSYQIQRSLRCNSSDSAYLSRTPASAGNRKTWTWAGWVKRSAITSSSSYLYGLFSAESSGNDYAYIDFYQDGLRVTLRPPSGTQAILQTTQVFRDPSAWYHIVVAQDTTQATASNRIKCYVNGSQITSFSTSTYLDLDAQGAVNQTVAHNVGRDVSNVLYSTNQGVLDGYLADIHFIDGQALDPSSFTEVSATTGQLIPKAYTGTYGTNGFHLPFSDNSATTATTLGKDTSGNGNNWTPNNLSVTAGAGNDSLVDTPTSYGTDTGAGGEVRGNYCTWNPLATGNLIAENGNLAVRPTSDNWQQIKATMGFTTGKWYWECTVNPSTTYANQYHGISNSLESPTTNLGTVSGFCYGRGGDKYAAGVNTAGAGSAYVAGDTIGMAMDLDSGTQTIKFYKNGSLQFTQTISGNGPWHPASNCYYAQSPAVFDSNFGQRAFAYPVSGYKALCDTNLGAPLVAKPNTVFDTILYSGNNSTQSITSLAFNPDMVWSKCRNVGRSYRLSDAIRGSNVDLYTDTTASDNYYGTGSITTFTANGFNLDNSASSQYNTSGETYVSWCWDAGSSTVTNTQGSITSSVRANASAGFSIVTYTGNLSSSGTSTVGHGLGVKPSMIIIKKRSGASAWTVQHASLATANTLIDLNSTAATYTSAYGTIVAPTSNVFTIAWLTSMGDNGADYVAYCFAPVDGYSSFGSYVGNGSASDGPFVYTGHRSRFVLIKRTDAADNWVILDTARNTYNSLGEYLLPNTGDGGASTTLLDINSNGFKLRFSGTTLNASGGTYIYFAVAESPFAYSRAR